MSDMTYPYPPFNPRCSCTTCRIQLFVHKHVQERLVDHAVNGEAVWTDEPSSAGDPCSVDWPDWQADMDSAAMAPGDIPLEDTATPHTPPSWQAPDWVVAHNEQARRARAASAYLDGAPAGPVQR